MAESYPLPVFHFQVEWGGAKMEFSEVSGMNLETQMIEYRNGKSKNYLTTKMPGLPKASEISLKRGIFRGNMDYYLWVKTIQLNKVLRRTVTIKLLDEEHNPVVTWVVQKAWPTKIENPTLKGDGNEVAIESMTIVHEGLEVVFT